MAGHPRGGPYPTGIEPRLAETIQEGRGRVRDGEEPMLTAQYVVGRGHQPDELVVAFGYLLNETAHASRSRLMVEQRELRAQLRLSRVESPAEVAEPPAED